MLVYIYVIFEEKTPPASGVRNAPIPSPWNYNGVTECRTYIAAVTSTAAWLREGHFDIGSKPDDGASTRRSLGLTGMIRTVWPDRLLKTAWKRIRPANDDRGSRKPPTPIRTQDTGAENEPVADGGQSAKVVGELDDDEGGIGVLGKNTAGSGTTYGVTGEVDSPDGYGLYTPDDARVDGVLTSNDDWVVEVEDSEDDAGNVVQGHSSTWLDGSVVGAVVGGGGTTEDPSVNRGPHEVYGDYTTIGGGANNQAGVEEGDANGAYSTVGGGTNNQAGGAPDGEPFTSHATVGGGGGNIAYSTATISGGMDNRALGLASTVGGGRNNLAQAELATVSGGGFTDSENREETANAVYDNYGTVGGGGNNRAGVDDDEPTTAEFATVGGGEDNEASGDHATVGGGEDNTASGSFSTVPGGAENTAAGDYSFAAGRGASADQDGAFVFGDSSDTAVTSDGADEARFQMQIVAEQGVDDQSARAAKTNVEPADAGTILDGVRSLAVSTWEYSDGDGNGTGRRHVGPMAEDFHDAFEVGDGKTINSIDRGGVAFAAIQALSEKLEEKDDRLVVQAERIDELESQNEALTDRVATLESRAGSSPVTTDD